MTRIRIATLLLAPLLLTAPLSGRSQPDPLADALKASYAAEANADYPAAIKPLVDLGPTGNGNYIVQYRLGWLNYCATNLTESVRRYSNASRLAPFALEPLLAAMVAEQAAGKYDDALHSGQIVLREDPNNYTALSHSAWLYYLKADYRQAATLYRRLVSRYPTDQEMLLGLGYSLKLAGDLNEAAPQFHTVLLLSPQNPRALAGLAIGDKTNYVQTIPPRR